MSLYDTDFYTWARSQADAARRRDGNELDWDNVSEELAALARSEARELFSRYAVLLAHLLKWVFQPEMRGRSWTATIAVQRRMIARLLAENPGLKPREQEEFVEAYRVARIEAAAETGLEDSIFPQDPPFSPDEAKNPEWLPD